jgi:hypothetical protein
MARRIYQPSNFSLIGIPEIDAQLIVLPANLTNFVVNNCTIADLEIARDDFVLAAEL